MMYEQRRVSSAIDQQLFDLSAHANTRMTIDRNQSGCRNQSQLVTYWLAIGGNDLSAAIKKQTTITFWFHVFKH